jgi:predicted ATPase/DNA-binding winged helix-turn-helix (wHTH) protein/Tfp pilus assembly protein PilF
MESPRRPAKLSPLERRLLAYLAEHPGEVFSKEHLLEAVWGLPAGHSVRRVFTAVERLRQKIESDPKNPSHLLTIGRNGYTFRPTPAPAQVRAEEPLALSAGFVGRQRELAQLEADLQPEHALVTLYGPGGVGKSRLAAELARQLVDQRAVWLVGLDDAQTAGEVLLCIARALDLGADPDPARTVERIGRVTRGGLLVLDGVERSASSVREIVSALGAARPRLLVTSLQPLGLEGERALALSPLPVEEGVALFTLLARARGLGGELAPAQHPSLRELVRELDGLPLAIELAASWSWVLEPSEILARRPESGLGDSGRPPRHRTLQATMSWSWEMLGQPEKLALASCAVFQGPFSAEAACAVLAVDLAEALALLGRLCERSLVQARAEPEGRRFQLLQVVRTFALAHLAQDPDAQREASRRHARYFGTLAQAELAELDRGQTHAAHQRIAAVQADLQQLVSSGSGEQAARAALVLSSYLRMLGPVGRWLELSTEALGKDAVPPDLRVRLMVSRAMALRYTGGAADALAELQQALAMAQQRAPAEVGDVQRVLGLVHAQAGRIEQAQLHLSRALELHRRHGDAYGEAIVLAELGTMAWGAHQLEVAAGRYREALGTLRRLGASHAEAVYLGNLGVVEMTRGRYALARSSLEEALALQRQLGSARFEAQVLTNLGVLAQRTGQPEEARGHWTAALPLARRSGDRRDEALLLLNLAEVGLALGDSAQANRSLDLAEAALAGLDLALHRATAALIRAAVLLLEGDHDQSEARLDEACYLAESHGLAAIQVRGRAVRGLLRLAQGDREAAILLLEEAERQMERSEAAPAEALELLQLREALGR